MGRQATRLLLDRIHSGPVDDHVEIVLRPRLIVRRTCGGRETTASTNSAR
jgi:DNA-binding LacI/PurR family transcriptional regulator